MKEYYTREDIIGLLGDFGTKDPNVVKKVLAVMPQGFAFKLARMDRAVELLGYYGYGLDAILENFRENSPAEDRGSRQDLLTGLSEGASMRTYARYPQFYYEEIEKRKGGKGVW